MLRIRIRWDMRLTDREVLKLIHNSKPMSQAAIAALLRCSERTVLRSVQRLEAAGYLEVVGRGNRYGPQRYDIHVEALPDDIRAEIE